MSARATSPVTRTGNCCGCGQYPVTLYKIPGLDRYRCATCFQVEVGNPATTPGTVRVLDDGARLTIADALRRAADLYLHDAALMHSHNFPRLSEQFQRQRAEALDMAEVFANASAAQVTV